MTADEPAPTPAAVATGHPSPAPAGTAGATRKPGSGGRIHARQAAEPVEATPNATPVRMRTKGRTGGVLGLFGGRQAAKGAAMEVVAKREETFLRLQDRFGEIGSTLRQIQATLGEERDRTASVAEKLHHLPEILAAMPDIAERQQVVLDRMADRTEALMLVPKALETVQAHARAQIEALVAIREGLEVRAKRDEAMIGALTDMSAAMVEVKKAGDAQIAEVRSLGDGQRALVDGVKDVGERTTRAMQEAQAATMQTIATRDRERRNRMMAVAAGVGVVVAGLTALAASATSRTLRTMQNSSVVLADTASRDMAELRQAMAFAQQAQAALLNRIAEKEEEMRLCLAAAEEARMEREAAHDDELSTRERELGRLASELEGLKSDLRRAAAMPAATGAPRAQVSAPSAPGPRR